MSDINMIDPDAFRSAALQLQAAEIEHADAQAAFDAARKRLAEKAGVLNSAKATVRAMVETAAGTRVWP